MSWQPTVLILLLGGIFTLGCTPQPEDGMTKAAPEVRVFDLTHTLTTFEPVDSDDPAQRFAPDLDKPIDGSRPVAAFSQQMVLFPNPDIPAAEGVFKLNTTILGENIGTSIDAGGHFAGKDAPDADQRTLADLTVEDLTGPMVFIDISQRVTAELAKNEGVPGPVDITDFSDASGNVVTAADIDAVADQLQDRTFVIVHTGWSQFYWDSGPGQEGPYPNGFNYPGFSKRAIERLIEVEEARGIRINGIGADNLTVDGGDSAGAPTFPIGAIPSHRLGLARGWKTVENIATTPALAEGRCELFIGAMNHRGGVAGWARIFARCEV